MSGFEYCHAHGMGLLKCTFMIELAISLTFGANDAQE